MKTAFLPLFLVLGTVSQAQLIDRGARAGDRWQTGLECNTVTMNDGQQYTNWRHKDLQPQEPGTTTPTVPGADTEEAWEAPKFHIAGKTYRMPGGPLGGIPQILHRGEWVNLDKLPPDSNSGASESGSGGGMALGQGGGESWPGWTPGLGGAPGDDIGGLPLAPGRPDLWKFPSVYN